MCRQRPPFPGDHLRACSWLLMEGTISQESPPSGLLNRAAGSTPAQRSFLPSPISMDQMFARARPSSLGKAGPDFVSEKDLPRSVERRTFIPKKGLQEEAKIFGVPRVSTRVE